MRIVLFHSRVKIYASNSIELFRLFQHNLILGMLQLLTNILNCLNNLKVVGKQKSKIIEAQNAVMKKLTQNAPTDAKVNIYPVAISIQLLYNGKCRTPNLFADVYCLLQFNQLHCCGLFIYTLQCRLIQ